MRRLLAPAAKLARALWDDLFPTTCPGCDAVTATADFCRGCRNEIEFTAIAVCARCQEHPALGGALCAGCCRSPSSLDAVYAGALYRGLCLERMRSFKYPPTVRLLDPGPEHFAMRLVLEAARRAGPAPDAVVPVPHHPRRLRARGFVPAALLARGLARFRRVPFRPGLLQRTRDTPSQTDLDRVQRRRNVRGAFRARAGAPPRIWLVDDVVTTAATLEDAARALREAGATSVVGIAAARTPAPQRETSSEPPQTRESPRAGDRDRRAF